MVFKQVSDLSEVALSILEKRYLQPGEKSWKDITNRVVNSVLKSSDDITKELVYEMILNRYFVPNSPCLVNAGKPGGGLLACFVVDFPDTIEGIYKTKFDFAKIARKGGGCGTHLSNLRPEGARVSGSTHGYAGGPIKFADTISHDMMALTQSGFREMALMFTMSVYHPDIIKFLTAKQDEGKLSNANISVVVDDAFMNAVENDLNHQTYFVYDDGKVEFGPEYRARDVFEFIVEGAWKNGEPGILFYNRINDSPYQYSGQEILSTNPCGEQPLPSNGSCNLGSLDISKFLNDDRTIDLELLELAVENSVKFLDAVITENSFPTRETEAWAYKNRPIGLGIMGLADYYLKRGVAYGSPQALEELSFIVSFIYKIAEQTSIALGEVYGVPEECRLLPVPRRNITLLTIAPTGTISLLAGCNSSIEPFFSDITQRKDKTGSYIFDMTEEAMLPHFRCAVSSGVGKEVTWKEHIDTLAVAQTFVDSGVSKTINFPNRTRKETVYESFMRAWKTGTIKGMTIYRNGSRDVEVLSPQNLKKDLCPLCSSEVVTESGCKSCKNCGWSLCEVA